MRVLVILLLLSSPAAADEITKPDMTNAEETQLFILGHLPTPPDTTHLLVPAIGHERLNSSGVSQRYEDPRDNIIWTLGSKACTQLEQAAIAAKKEKRPWTGQIGCKARD